ncbi:MAG: flagellar FliJ family protein [Ignavibacteria bacterium]|nr:flagellar FliJ family protein [Ignavibacteria bacterium]
MAKKFIYRLESLLNLKSFKVKEIEESIQKVLYYKIQTENEINRNEEYLASLNGHKNGSFKVIEIQALNYHKDCVKEEIRELREQLSRIIEIENILRMRLVEAMKEEKVLQKLKEKEFENYKFAINKEETKLLDEISIQKEVRKKGDEE